MKKLFLLCTLVIAVGASRASTTNNSCKNERLKKLKEKLSNLNYARKVTLVDEPTSNFKLITKAYTIVEDCWDGTRCITVLGITIDDANPGVFYLWAVQVTPECPIQPPAED